MASVQIIIKLDNGTTLSDTTANPTDVQINTVINMVGNLCGYTAKVFDGDGNEIDNPQSKPDFFVAWLRTRTKEKLTTMAADAAAEAAAATVKATPVTF